jgi:DNA-binding winged helix-turn-helix (wHTH) protein
MTASRLMHFDRFELDPYRRSLTIDGTPVPMPTQLMSALIYLIRRRDAEVTRPELRRALYRREESDTDAALDRCVAALRRLLGDSDRRPRLIVTKPRMGYRFVGTLAGDPCPDSAEPSPRLLTLGAAPPADEPDLPPPSRLGERRRSARVRRTLPVWNPLPGLDRLRSSPASGT